jgi:KDO2-lipid IV(A) lauroyltransferase
VRNYVEYLALRGLLAVLQALSLTAGYVLARGLAWLAYHVDWRHRAAADENLCAAYPTWPAQQRDAVIRRMYRHYAMMVIEIAHLSRKLRPYTWKRYMSLRGGAELVAALLSGRPILVVTGHFGNWELAGYALAMCGFKSYAVARPLDNPWLDRLVRRIRQNTGQELLNKKGDAGRMAQVLDQGGILCTLADQDAGQHGLFVPFFGRPASTHKAVALLALHHEVLLVVAAARRSGPGLDYIIDVEEVIDCRQYADDPQAVRTLTADYTTAWERLVRKAPEQYLWLHRRWKHQPKVKERRRAA